MRRSALAFALIIAALLLHGADQRAAIAEALAALQRGDFATAEKALRADLQTHPNDAPALTLLGVALDNLGKSPEAGEIHRRAVANAPRSVDVLNNYATHLISAGKEDEARKIYQQVVAIDPGQFNANVQLARLAVRQKNGRDALSYLQHVPANQQATPQIAVLRVEALYLTGDRADAEALLTQLAAATGDNLGLNFSVGLELANAGQYEHAENFFTKALAAAPADINVLVNLGVVASHAGHTQRAREVLDAALRQQPQNVDVLYNLALVDSTLHQPEDAVRLLAQAARIAPRRADIQKLLAITTGDLGALEDAAAAWERYLKLEPADDSARRERGFTAIQMGKFEQGMPDLEWFVSHHPDDAVGHFELGQAESKDEPAKGLAHLDRAIALKRDFAAAHAFRGSLYYQSGKFEEAVKDLEAAAKLRPDDAVTLDRLGQTYSSLDRPVDAVRVLRRAAELAPDDSKTVLHFARALADAGNAAESKSAMDRFRQLGPVSNKSVPGGLIDYLSLTPEQQRADYRARVEKAARANPNDAAAQVNLLKSLLEGGTAEQIAATAHRIVGLKPASPVLADAGHALLESRHYEPAKELLEQAGASADVGLDLALAVFHTSGARDGLARLDKVPEAGRGGDYYLARALMLVSGDSGNSLAQALERSPKRVDLYEQAIGLLVQNRLFPEALKVIGKAVETMPQNREILLARATTLELAGHTANAEKQLAEMQNRWPEWHAIWVAQGAIRDSHGQFDEARKALETAMALGARSPEAYYYLADSCLRSAPTRLDSAEAAIRKAAMLAPEDQVIRNLAERIATAKSGNVTTPSQAEARSGMNPAPLSGPDLRKLFLGRPAREW